MINLPIKYSDKKVIPFGNINLKKKSIGQIWSICNTRVDCKNRIKESEQNFRLDNFRLQNFWGTTAFFIAKACQIKHVIRKALKITSLAKKGYWVIGFFAQKSNLSPPFVYPIA